jgi:hypothetical protein
MLNFLAHDGSMPDELSGWMEDFVSEAFGTSFDPEEIQDAEEVSRRAKRLWDRSGFSEPVRNVVRSSFEQAELMSMEAASNKIENLAKTMSNLLEVREGGVSLDVEKVQALIRSLSEDSSTLASLRKDVEERVREAAKEVGSHVKKAESKSRKQLAKSLEKFFKEGRSIAAESRELVKQQRLSEEKAIAERRESFRDDAPLKTFGKLLGFLAKIPVNHGSKVVVGETDILWDPANPVVVLAENERDKLNSLLKRILKETNKLVELANEAFESDIRILVHELEAGIQGEFQATGDSIKQAVDKHTKNAGINLDFQLPKLPRFDVDVQVKHIVESSVDEEKLNEERTRQVRRDSVGGKLKRGLGSLFGQSDWGYDTQTYFVEKTNLRLDLGQMRESLLQEVHESFSGLESNVNKYLKEDLGSRLDGYFKELDVRVRQIQGDLARSMGDRGKEKAVLSEFLARLKKMKSKSGNVASEAATLVNQIQGKVRLVRSTSP